MDKFRRDEAAGGAQLDCVRSMLGIYTRALCLVVAWVGICGWMDGTQPFARRKLCSKCRS